MTPKEQAAMQQALDALEMYRPLSLPIKLLSQDKTREEAITALREALAEQAEQEPKYWTYVVNGTWRNIDSTEPPDDAYDEGTLEPLYAAPVSDCFAIETDSSSSSMRTTVRTKDLTDDEFMAIMDRNRGENHREVVCNFARAVIAADREKNK